MEGIDLSNEPILLLHHTATAAALRQHHHHPHWLGQREGWEVQRLVLSNSYYYIQYNTLAPGSWLRLLTAAVNS